MRKNTICTRYTHLSSDIQRKKGIWIRGCCKSVDRDFNARVGRRRYELEMMLVQNREKVRNLEGEMLMDFCLRRGLMIMNGYFQQRRLA